MTGPGYGTRVVPPTKRPPLKPRASRRKKPESAPRVVEHKTFGQGTVVGVRQLNGGLAADVDFDNAGKRTIRLQPEFWVSPIDDMTALAA